MNVLSAIALALALGIALVGQVREPAIDGSEVDVSNEEYDFKPLNAPALTGSPLKYLGWFVTQSMVSPFIVRHLINDNKIYQIRAFASHFPELPPTYYPMARISGKEYGEFVRDEDAIYEVVRRGALKAPPSKYFTIQDYHELYMSKKKKPSDMMERVIRGVEELDPKLKMFSSFIKEDVMEQAKASDERWAAGKPLSVLDGVPIPVKDMVDAAKHKIYHGGSVMTEGVEDDVIVKRLRSLGAIILGMTMMTEGGVTPLGYNAHFDGPFNPYNTEHYSGGSSSGSAVAVAVGLAPAAIGWDGGGSIRIPASMCGAFGLAVTFGRIPFGNEALGNTNVKAGPIAATSADAAILYAALSLDSPSDHFYNILYDGGNYGLPPPSLASFSDIDDLTGMRIGVFREFFMDSDAKVHNASFDALETLKRKGATIVDIKIPHLRIMSLSHGIKITSEFALFWDTKFHDPKVALEPNTEFTIALGKTLTANEVLAGQRVRTWGMQKLREIFEENNLDVIASPTISTRVPKIPRGARHVGENNAALVLELLKYIFLANFLGMPGMSIPINYDDEGLPIGFHVFSKHWHENKLLRISNCLERFHLQRRTPHPSTFIDLHD